MEDKDKNYEKNKLKNGLVIASQKNPTQTISAKLRVNYGAYHEGKDEEGMAHFLEHSLVTGGSEKYDPHESDKIRSIFGESNAFTNIGRTFFVGGFLTKNFERWLDYVSNHVFNPRFDKNKVNEERGRILGEISEWKSNPGYKVSKDLNPVLYKGHPLERNALGSEKVVKNASIDKLREFHSVGYHPNNMDLLVAGDLPSNLDELVERYFGSQSRGSNTRVEFPNKKPIKGKNIINAPAPERFNKRNPQESSAQIYLFCDAPNRGEEDEVPIKALNLVLGRGSNSLLFKNVGSKNGAYSCGSGYDGNYNAGQINVGVNVPVKNLESVVGSIFEQFNLLKKHKADNESVEKIKNQSKYGFAKDCETNEGQISIMEKKLDDGIDINDYLKLWDELTSEDIQKSARKYLPDRENGNYLLYIRNPLIDGGEENGN